MAAGFKISGRTKDNILPESKILLANIKPITHFVVPGMWGDVR